MSTSYVIAQYRFVAASRSEALTLVVEVAKVLRRRGHRELARQLHHEALRIRRERASAECLRTVPWCARRGSGDVLPFKKEHTPPLGSVRQVRL